MFLTMFTVELVLHFLSSLFNNLKNRISKRNNPNGKL